MKSLLAAIALSRLWFALAHGPDDGAMAAPTRATPPLSTMIPMVVPRNSTTTSEGCLKLFSDKEWPSPAEWTAVLPRVLPRARNLLAGLVRPDYHLTALSVADVQVAVKFCAKHGIRLTIINSGHVSNRTLGITCTKFSKAN
jgi:hypothetical protein